MKKYHIENNMIGIYKIENLKTGDFYIGSSINVNKRFIRHKTQLKKLKHSNYKLQKDFIKYGSDYFNFQIIEECDKTCLIELEQHYLDLYKPSYNILKRAYSNLGYKHTPETIEKLRILAKNNAKNNHYIFNQPRGEKAIMAKEFKLIDPTGNICSFRGLDIFCKQHNLDTRTINKVLSGKYHQHKGYRKYVVEEVGINILPDTFCHKTRQLKSPTGEIIIFDNIRKFCKENNLHRATVLKVINGTQKQTKNWTKV